ncbi:MAG: hypothetical protein V1768_00180 [Patescibacteria group bacterium]|nr:hypothetical protein [Patescibacteria group bacterium]MBU1684496.1 hypothetical protein [Patescibacteria group bacterium]MBU1778641.1 hypothetical protein [Patescibacteria group bacterium]MBU1987323.1 hypothetical protein [Patescibacteria group bacterium]MBU2416236.1 hypothetical protein [Patescibacteria group bacterium]
MNDEYLIFVEGRETNAGYEITELEALKTIRVLEANGKKVVLVTGRGCMDALPKFRRMLEEENIIKKG